MLQSNNLQQEYSEPPTLESRPTEAPTQVWTRMDIYLANHIVAPSILLPPPEQYKTLKPCHTAAGWPSPIFIMCQIPAVLPHGAEQSYNSTPPPRKSSHINLGWNLFITWTVVLDRNCPAQSYFTEISCTWRVKCGCFCNSATCKVCTGCITSSSLAPWMR
jgi:hypothetical protein